MVFRLKPGQDLKQSIQDKVDSNGILAGWILTCVGSLTRINMRYANQSGGIPGEGYFEIVSLSGTVSKNGSHLHLLACNSEGEAFGGHLLDGNLVYTTAEIVIGYDPNLVFTRELDGNYNELVIRSGRPT